MSDIFIEGNSDEDHGILTQLLIRQGDKWLIKDVGKVMWKEELTSIAGRDKRSQKR